MTEIIPKKFSDVYKNLGHLFKRHGDEVLGFSGEYGINEDVYLKLEEGGRVIFFTAEDDGVVVGYCTYIISEPLHLKNMLYSFQDLLYVVPEKRGSGVGNDLVLAAEEKSRELGCNKVFFTQKANIKDSKVALELGYSSYEKTFIKDLNNG